VAAFGIAEIGKYRRLLPQIVTILQGGAAAACREKEFSPIAVPSVLLRGAAL